MLEIEDYTIGWICALPLELTAAIAVLDERHETPESRQENHDDNTYVCGCIGKHNIVITCLPSGVYGVTSASNVVTKMRASFPSVKIGLMVGIGGGAPMLPQNDIRLGDVVVSEPVAGFGGVLQYDFGKTVQSGKFVQHGVLNKPPSVFLKTISKMKSEHISGHAYEFNNIATDVLENGILPEEFRRPPNSSDRLFQSKYDHPEENGSCDDCDTTLLVEREPRARNEARLHYGLIASGNQVMKHGLTRDKLSQEKGVLCFEMEAAGLMDELPSLVIRGICDYCDSHKNKGWQNYAALVAAAFARELLFQLPLQGSPQRPIPSEEDNFNVPGLQTAKGASFGDYDDQYEPECLPGTRVDLLKHIGDWTDDVEGKKVFWMYGMAGTGKSTISRTVARSLQTNGRLGGSFFFKRGEASRSTGLLFVVTLAAQLARSLRGTMASSIRAVLKAEPDTPSKSLEEQFRKLIFGPLAEFRARNPHDNGAGTSQPGPRNSTKTIKHTRVMVVDALDECEGKGDVQVIIQQLAKLKDLTEVDIRVFLTSRPDLPIIPTFQKLKEDTYVDLVLHEVPDIEDDISLYLKTEMSRIAEERHLPEGWPGAAVVQTLVKMATPLFIYAATICRFVGDEHWNPNERVKMISEYEPKWQVSRLDKTYLPILEQLLASQHETERGAFVQEFKDIVGTIINLQDPLSVRTLSQLIQVSDRTIESRLRSLHSVLDVPNDPKMPIRTFHKSFPDFLLDQNLRRKSQLWVDARESHERILDRCLDVMSNGLKFNICELKSVATPRSEIDDRTIQRCISPELRYACCHWTEHLQKAKHRLTDNDKVSKFLQQHCLHWIEALTICDTDLLRNVIGISFSCLDWNSQNKKVRELVMGVEILARQKQHILLGAPLQVYLTSTVFVPWNGLPKRALSDEKFLQQYKDNMRHDRLWRLWSFGCQLFPYVSAISSDGRVLAYSLTGRTAYQYPFVVLWDLVAEAPIRTLGTRSGLAKLKFSPDNKILFGKNQAVAESPSSARLRTRLKSSTNTDLGSSIVFWHVKTGVRLSDHIISGRLHARALFMLQMQESTAVDAETVQNRSDSSHSLGHAGLADLPQEFSQTNKELLAVVVAIGKGKITRWLFTSAQLPERMLYKLKLWLDYVVNYD
ncbi:hypothetical protein TWF225_000822 [Orbilia oligospora]|nr:hypothetical protein TWF225_000822 [Orbilia oligospora]KAF3250359.1 hypothetical protein TWF128_007515 [Orbilia oligospora]KAF3263712.1 hypothetical protein TWF217_003425 [Orbilia oligospora]KAF3285770.1 hypothetical protein TWF132_009132 [Orbilia oligospora]